MAINGSSSPIPYRRLTDPLSLPYGTNSQRFVVPAGYIPAEATTFRVTNSGASWVRLKGAQGSAASTLAIQDGEGWLYPPGFSGIFTTQYPEAMATISVAKGGVAAGSGILEISYGMGGGGESIAALVAAGGSFPTGAAGTPNANVVTVQGIMGGTAQPVTVGNFPATQPVSGSVSVSNFPASQPVSGSVSVSNFPATQPISGSVILGAGTNLIGAVQARGTGSMVTGHVAMSAQNTAYQVAPARATRRSITFVPTSQFTYFYGNSGVTLTTGAAAVNGAAITLETTAAIFVISSSTGTMTFVEHF